MLKLRLREKFILIIGLTILAVSGFFLIWLGKSQKEMQRAELVEKARVMHREMNAVWDYIEINQDRINYSAAGVYDFKGMYCSIVGKSVGKLFSRGSDYEFHYTSLKPRNFVSEPDEFEIQAMVLLKQQPDQQEYYEVTEYRGKPVFRYVAKLEIKQACLRCHGEPAGELDETGYAKEGLKIGDMVGAISMIMPMESYEASLAENVKNGFLFFLALMVLISVILYVSVSRLILSPLQKLRTGVNQMAEGHTGVQVEVMENPNEIGDLVQCFNEMSQDLNTLYEGLEGQVENRNAELRALNRVLEEKQIQLEQVNQSLREENRSKTDFLAVMTHELRTPLTSTIIFTDMLLEMEGAKDAEEADIIQRIRANTENLLNTINNTLHLFRLEMSVTQLELEVIDIIDVVGALEDHIRPIYEKKGIELTADVDLDVPLFVADSEMIFHILENLLSNAGKFTPAGGHVSLRVSYEEEHWIVFRVEDNGIGIEKGDQERIFEKYTQGDRLVSRRYGGSGLGLTLVKNWTELHGGQVSVESEAGRGSVFTVRIPADIERAGKTGKEETNE